MEKLLGLPVVASQHGKDVDGLIIYVHWLMIALFIGWLAYFAYALVRFRRSRNPRADHVGVKSHASNYIEVAVALVEAVLLVGFAVPLWAKISADFPKESESTVVQVVAQQFNWNYRYAGEDGKLGKQDMRLVNDRNVFGVDPADEAGKDDLVPPINEMHVPVGKPVIAYISSKDVIHSFKIIALRLTQDAIPGLKVPVHFVPTKVGRYQINCAQLCGNGHYSMSQGFLVVDTPEDYAKWAAAQPRAAAGPVSYE